MKKNLFWSLLAATAMMTACSEDTLTDNQPVLTGAETPVAFSVNLGNAISTYATNDAVGGWTNFKNNQLTDYQARVTIQVFAGNNQDAPYAQVRKLVPYQEGMSDKVEVDNLRLPAGNSYTAVTWVDFVSSDVTTSTTEEPNDCYWNTENLTKVSETAFAADIAEVAKSPEARDAYTGKISFTVNADGTYNAGEAQEQKNTAAINIDARRTFAKVSLVLTDYDNKSDWANAFKNVGSARVLDYLAMGVENLSTGYNALSQAPLPATGTKYFHRGFAGVADENASVNDVNWIEEDGKFYPVFDFNYIIPAVADRNSADAVYTMQFKGYNHGNDEAAFTSALAATDEISTSTTADEWKLVAYRSGSAIPVRTNCHTVIKLNLYKAYKCTVTIYDNFDNNKEDVTINDDDTKASTDTHYIGQNGPVDAAGQGIAKVVVNRDNDGVATDITITGVTADNFKAVMTDIDAMKNLGTVPVNMTASTIPAEADFSKIPATNPINLTVTAQDADTKLEGMNSALTLDMTNTAATTVNSGYNVTIAGTTLKGAVIVSTTANATINSGVFGAAVTVDAATATLAGGTYAEGATINEKAQSGNAVISGGTYAKVVTAYSNTTISGGTSNATADSNRAFFMANSTDKKIVKVANAVFGVLYASPVNGGSSEDSFHELDFQENKDLFNEYSSESKLGSNWNKINTNQD